MADLPSLTSDDFAAFFEGVHGVTPFPWQARLARDLASGHPWPQVLDLPTGSGKTAAIDIAVFQLALSPERAERTAPLRIVYVVDRRTIVDQAYERALQIVHALDKATSGILETVRRRLSRYAREATPLRTALLRGAIARSDLWARTPDQPLIVVSTVDQVGSRLLFRGYGVSDSMKPIHAGLLGHDALYLLDEVHLSEPFRTTLTAVSQRYASWAERIPGRGITVVEMSATSGGRTSGSFRLDEEDARHAVLSRRLHAAKPTSANCVTARAFLGEMEKHVTRFASPAGATVAAVVNRVRTARDLHRQLTASIKGADVHLLTGRMRPLDRDGIETALFPRIRAGRARDRLQRPVVIVATQCIEAGADFDFDALVTECASLDALRQRFGRLDRFGNLDGDARGVVVAQKDTLDGDPVYGTALGATWRWIEARGGVLDFGIDALEPPDDAIDLGVLGPKAQAPTLLPSHLDAWAQTSPIPTPDPDVSLWLHGPGRGAADVQVVWRADISAELLEAASNSNDPRGSVARDVAIGAVQAIPPASGEAMSVPFVAVRRWLRGETEADVFDVEGAQQADVEPGSAERAVQRLRAALVWRGEESEVIDAERLRPGDTVVIPTTYGGIANGTWDPLAEEPTRDVAEVAVFRQRGRAFLRLHPAVIEGLCGRGAPHIPLPAPGDAEDADDRDAVRTWLQAAATCALRTDVAQLVEFLTEQSRRRGLQIERLPLGIGADAGEYFLVSARRRAVFDGAEVSTEDDEASFTGVGISLVQHLCGVADTAAEFAYRLGIPGDIARDVSLAARWHDLGKVDPRFQRLLHGGSEFKTVIAREPLAKSATQLHDGRARREARRRSAYPPGTRHELLSLALLERVSSELPAHAHDLDLVLHLVASHHGWCRPFAPWAPDPTPVDVAWEIDGLAGTGTTAHALARLDSGVGERFWRLVRRYGWWGLAWLEAVLRLADHRRSEEEQTVAGGAA